MGVGKTGIKFFLLISLSAAFLLLLPRISSGELLIGGSITEDTIWALADSPIIADNVTVESGVTLTIEPGVEVRFNETCRLLIYGTLIASGTPENWIIFTSNKEWPYSRDWDRIYFYDTYDNPSRLEYCEISYGGWSGGENGVIHCHSSSPRIAHCEIRDNYNGIRCIGKSGPSIVNS